MDCYDHLEVNLISLQISNVHSTRGISWYNNYWQSTPIPQPIAAKKTKLTTFIEIEKVNFLYRFHN